MSYFLQLLIAAAVLFLGLGAFLLDLAFSDSSRDQLPALLGGAFFVSLGLLLVFLVCRPFLKWLQHDEVHDTGNK